MFHMFFISPLCWEHRGELCLESKSFLSLSPECLRLVIESDDLKCKEEIIYQKIIDWSTKRCQDQNQTANDESITVSINLNTSEEFKIVRFISCFPE
jgi:hypothetical protein